LPVQTARSTGSEFAGWGIEVREPINEANRSRGADPDDKVERVGQWGRRKAAIANRGGVRFHELAAKNRP
jgi:hypothetical protein